MSIPTLDRATLKTSRLMEFCSKKELEKQTSHRPHQWPEVIVKELVDNALDACEDAHIAPKITIHVDKSCISVEDNGPGLPADTITGVLDFSHRVSSREAYIAPDRGAQGNALKTIVAMPFALDGDSGRVDITSHGQLHRIEFSVDPIAQEPVVSREIRDADVKNGTKITVWWPKGACSQLESRDDEILQVARGFCLLNPHLRLEITVFGETWTMEPSSEGWAKWRPSHPTPAHWWRPEDLERLLAGYIAADRAEGKDRAVRNVVREFRGLSGTAKQKAVLGATELARTNLSAFVNGKGLKRDVVTGLLDSMRENSRPVKPQALGVIGKEHILGQLVDAFDIDVDTFLYRRALGETIEGLPYVVEVAFAALNDDEAWRVMITGANWSPGILDPFRQLGTEYSGGLDSLLVDQRADDDAPVAVVVHLACPRLDHTDRGKSAIALDNEVADAIRDAVCKATARWSKTIKEEERDARRREERRQKLRRQANRKMSIVEAAFAVMPEAYMHASSSNTLPTKARQIMYAARRQILEMTGKDKLNSRYFSQVIVPRYLEEHPEETADWDVIYDARGQLVEPHTGRRVPLGTKEVRTYMSQFGCHITTDIPGLRFPATVSTCGPQHRFGGLLFNEKEGFDEAYAVAQLPDRYDIATLSTKGITVTAARKLAEEICSQFDIPLFALCDFDKSGLTIRYTFQHSTRRYKYTKNFRVIDMGIRLSDVQEWGLESEHVSYGFSKTTKKPIDPRPNLRKSGATEEEIEFLAGERGAGGAFIGRRVELNAFTTGNLIKFIEQKLEEHGIAKVVPPEDVLQDTYLQAYRVAQINRRVEEVTREVCQQTTSAVIPGDLTATVKDVLATSPAMSWDQAIADLCTEAVL